MEGDSIMEEGSIKECMAELKVKHQSQFHKAFSLLVTSGLETLIRCENYSSLQRLLRTTAYVLKFISNVKSKAKGLEAALGPGLDSSDIAASKLYWIKACQETLVQDDKFKEWKSQFGLFLDNAGVWRCTGRLENANLSASTMHPILLPNRHHFVSLQVLDCHSRVMHGGVKETLTELRMSFWIVKGQSVVKRLLHQCTICTRFNG